MRFSANWKKVISSKCFLNSKDEFNLPNCSLRAKRKVHVQLPNKLLRLKKKTIKNTRLDTCRLKTKGHVTWPTKSPKGSREWQYRLFVLCWLHIRHNQAWITYILCLRLSSGKGYRVSSQERICCCIISLHFLVLCVHTAPCIMRITSLVQYLDTLAEWRLRGLKGSSNQDSPKGFSVRFHNK